MNNIKVSVIMPIYNASKFLRQSLESVVNQTLQDIEIICVNDGSKDDSLSIIKEYATNNSRIRIIDKDNSGYGNSMNQGLKIAKGEYIGILEPDDFMETTMFYDLYTKAKQFDADVVKSNYYEHEGETHNDNFFEVLQGLPYDQLTSAAINERILHMRPCIWSAIYRRELLLDHNIWFNETPGASYQDTAFAFKVLVSAEKIVFVESAYLHYRIDNDSSSVNSSGKIFNICDEFQSIQSFLNYDKDLRNKYSKILQVLKLDSYTWNLGRISEPYKEVFRDQIALDFLKAEYEGFLDKNYFDEGRWNMVQRYIMDYRKSHISNNNGRSLLKILVKRLRHKFLFWEN